jgi:hypothetical protein
MKTRTLSLLGALAAFACAGGVTAQEQGGGPPPGGAGAWGPGAMHQGMGEMHQRMEERKAAHMKALHDALNIRPDQEGAFAAFAAAMASGHDADGPHGDGNGGERDDMAGLTTPERLDRMAQRMNERFARMKAAFDRRADAAKALYAVLNPDQRRTLDALQALKATDEEREGHHGQGHGRDGMGGPDHD